MVAIVKSMQEKSGKDVWKKKSHPYIPHGIAAFDNRIRKKKQDSNESGLYVRYEAGPGAAGGIRSTAGRDG